VLVSWMVSFGEVLIDCNWSLKSSDLFIWLTFI
jgi:hypothetical protein